jgi:hypothetical protein
MCVVTVLRQEGDPGFVVVVEVLLLELVFVIEG